ncbi:MAG: hypothetical protein WCF62_15735, partial [Pseudolabrys sp.]
MCDFDSRTARWGLDVPATLLARADEVMNAEYPLLGVKRTWPVAAHMSAYDPKRTSCRVRLALPEYARELLPSLCQSLGDNN